jgi:perosamine synthetase
MSAPEVLFQRLQPMPPAHPRPWFPTLPVIGRAGDGGPAFPVDSRFFAPDTLMVPSGKVATYWALRDAGVGPGDRVAVPAYHCPTMIYPIVALRARPVFMPVGAGLELTGAAVAEALRERVRAVILPHYFGFVQPDTAAVVAACRAAGAVLVEDCAHALYARRGSALPGAWGDYAIASTRKFVPGSEGGALVANQGQRSHPRREPGWTDELRGLWRLLGDAAEVGAIRWPAATPTGLIGPPDEAAAAREALPTPAPAAEIDASACDRLALRSVRRLFANADHDRIAAVRRRRYARWAEALGALPQVRAFAPTLADDQVPYVFPVRLSSPQAQFRALKYRGIAVWRWDHLAQSRCAVSAELALSLIQLPCQHSLDDDAFERLVREFTLALS